MFVESALSSLVSFGLLDVVLPFIVSYTIVFALLEKTKPFGDGKRNISIILSLVIGLTTVALISLRSFYVLIFASAGVVLGGFFLIFLLGVFGIQMSEKIHWYHYMLPILILALILMVLYPSYIDDVLEYVLAPSVVAPLVVVGVLFLLLRDPQQERSVAKEQRQAQKQRKQQERDLSERNRQTNNASSPAAPQPSSSQQQSSQAPEAIDYADYPALQDTIQKMRDIANKK